MAKQDFRLTIIEGPEGNSAYLNDRRIAGPKPWGGGTILHEWTVTVQDLQRAVPGLRYAPREEAPDA